MSPTRVSRAYAFSAPRAFRALRIAVVATVVALGTLLLAAGPRASAGPACPGASANPGSVPAATLEAATLCLVNAERRRHGLRPLGLNASVAAAARGHARDMLSHGYISHFSGSAGPATRIARAGFHCLRSGCPRGEDIAWSSIHATPARIVAMWMHSAGHRYNILYPTYSVAGVGVAAGGRYASGGYYVLDFAGHGR